MRIFGKKEPVQHIVQSVQLQGVPRSFNFDVALAEVNRSRERLIGLEQEKKEVRKHFLELLPIFNSALEAHGLPKHIRFLVPKQGEEEEYFQMLVGSHPVQREINQRTVVHEHAQADVQVQEQETRASRQHEEIVALRNQTPPATFRKIAGDLELPLSSVQNEVKKHSGEKCSCFT